MENINFIHGGNIYEAEKKYKRKFIDFSASINPLGIPQNIKIKIFEEFDRILHYPDTIDTLKAISKYHNITEKNILLGNGSSECIFLVFTALKPKNVIIPYPTFSEYQRAAEINGCKVLFSRLNIEKGFSLDLSKIINSDMIFICNPNNPTGNIIINSKNEIKNLPQKFIVIDETFIDFLPDSPKYSFIHQAVNDKRIIVIRSFTKIFAMPGLRIGYIVAHESIINELKKYQIPWSINSIGLYTAILMLKNKTYIKKTLKIIKKERKYLSDKILKTDCFITYPSVTNFILVKTIKKGLTSLNVKQNLIKKGLLIRDCSNFKGLDEDFFRIAILSHKDNLKMISYLKKICKLCKQ